MGWEDEARLQALEHGEALPGAPEVELTTYPPTRDHRVLDVVLHLHAATSGINNAVAGLAEGLLGDGRISFQAVKDGLRRQAKLLGADAVAGVTFAVHPTDGGWTLMGTGTAIRYARKTPPVRYKPLNAGVVLARAGLPQYIKPFMDAHVKADRVPHLGDAELRTLGVGDVDHRARILQAIAEARQPA